HWPHPAHASLSPTFFPEKPTAGALARASVAQARDHVPSVAQYVVGRLDLRREPRGRADGDGHSRHAQPGQRLDLRGRGRGSHGDLDIRRVSARLPGGAAHLVEELTGRATCGKVAVAEAPGPTSRG